MRAACLKHEDQDAAVRVETTAGGCLRLGEGIWWGHMRAFDDEAGRDAHLNGKVAAALMEKAKAGDLFAKTPEIHKLAILADKLPK